MPRDAARPARPATWFALLGAVVLAAVVTIGVVRATDSSAADAAPSSQARLLTFSGTGTAHVQPDSASISAGVTATGSSADAAQDAASTRMAALLKHMRGQGLAASDLQTDDASVSEDWDHEGRFTANQSLTIRVTDPSRAGKLLGEATQGGADSVSGPSFGLDDQRAGYAEALRQAVADARSKADAAAAQMDAKVHAVYSIGETGAAGESPQPMYAMAAGAVSKDAAVDVPTEQGTQDVSLTVTVSFTYDR